MNSCPAQRTFPGNWNGKELKAQVNQRRAQEANLRKLAPTSPSSPPLVCFHGKDLPESGTCCPAALPMMSLTVGAKWRRGSVMHGPV